jgi:hypothetical protein
LNIHPRAARAPQPGPARQQPNYKHQEERWDTPAGAPWTYELSFRSRASRSFLGVLRELLGGSSPEVHVFLPPDAPFALEVDVSQGGGEIELGGLRLTSAELETSQGGVKLAVSSPVQAPLERFAITASMGGIETVTLGNASPRALSLEASMGGVELDLRGRWITDSTIVLSTRMGGMQVVLPDDVNVAGVEGRIPDGRPAELPLPTLTFETRAEMGEIEFR